MLHLDLFSGIGGFAYAVDQVWDDVEHIFCDNDKFCQQVLKKHWPESLIYGDIRTITADTDFVRHIHGQSKEQPTEQPYKAQRKPKPSVRAPFILTGGFPCQPFSQAGLRRGTSDDRYLWPEMLRVIRLTEPEWIIAENVGGFVTWNEGLVLETVCTDLEAAGYEVQPFIIPAVAVNAPHRRDRVWIIAHRNDSGKRIPRSGTDKNRSQEIQEQQQPQFGISGQDNDDTNSERKGRPGSSGKDAGQLGFDNGNGFDKGWDWDKNWLKVATQFCSVDNGLPVELDGFELSKSAHRKEQLKAYGNAIVPQVAIEIMKGMKL